VATVQAEAAEALAIQRVHEVDRHAKSSLPPNRPIPFSRQVVGMSTLSVTERCVVMKTGGS
jgi:hypothetical protein